jgi:CheY-like chemotaxis protein
MPLTLMIEKKVVLVVEDNFLIRITTVNSLVDAGYEVLEADHAAGALIILEDRWRAIHALCTDIQMPGEMDGLQLAHHAHRHWPLIGLLVVSGKVAAHLDPRPAGCRYLAKPFADRMLIEHVRALLA